MSQLLVRRAKAVVERETYSGAWLVTLVAPRHDMSAGMEREMDETGGRDADVGFCARCHCRVDAGSHARRGDIVDVFRPWAASVSGQPKPHERVHWRQRGALSWTMSDISAM